MKKIIFLFMIICVSFSLDSCVAKKNNSENKRLVVYQDFKNDETGIVKATLTIEWSDHKISSIKHTDLYKTKNDAQMMFKKLSNEFKELPECELKVNEKTITYNEADTSTWKDLSYEDMVKLLKDDGIWKIKEDG